MTERRCVASLLVKFVFFFQTQLCPARHVSGCCPQVERSNIIDDQFNVAYTIFTSSLLGFGVIGSAGLYTH